ncbi:MAG: putative ABC transporter ATP-binding protein [Candidatus Methanofastidiosum methylothiophilum]|uniref:Putative ABC transporter ATP-binding protein n=1 Tax=Candidatus Methanofastidiosum methylothiophilum TaxID=1705564 RepID=A0A150J418_9EURY|nr:MAG: putative ABC transporter ATP-binding protein [Candidatus Methanofastidiosum methylthiophilus]
MIEINNFSFFYPASDKKSLHGINLTIDKGDFVLISGPTGAGKTTLCLSIAGIMHHFNEGVKEGNIYLENKDIMEYKHFSEISKKLGILFDDVEAQLILTTVEEEIQFGLENRGFDKSRIESILEETLDKLDIKPLRKKAPHELSGGQKQRVALASILALDPEIIILDEPTSELDPVYTKKFFNILSELNKDGKTIIVVENKLDELLPMVKKMVVLKEGKIVVQGSPDKILHNKEARELIDLPQYAKMAILLEKKGIPLKKIPYTLKETRELIDLLVVKK